MSFIQPPNPNHRLVQPLPTPIELINRSYVQADDSLSSCPVCGGCLSTIVSYITGFFSWLLSFLPCSGSEKPQEDPVIDQRNAEVFDETYKFCHDEVQNQSPLGQQIKEAIDHTFYYAPTSKLTPKAASNSNTQFYISNGDRIGLAHSLALPKQSGKGERVPLAQVLAGESANISVLLLNPADGKTPGGEKKGAKGYEATVCRRTALYPCLRGHFEDKPEHLSQGNCALLTTKVPILRYGSDRDYAFIPEEERTTISIFSSAAPQYPALSEDNSSYADPGMRQQMKELIYRQFSAAFQGSSPYSALVLTAFGCDVGHPPKVIAELYKEVIKEYYPNIFPKIFFVLKPEQNKAFADVFDTAQMISS